MSILYTVYVLSYNRITILFSTPLLFDADERSLKRYVPCLVSVS